MEPRTNFYDVYQDNFVRQMAEEIDNEVIKMVNKQYKKAYNIVSNPCAEVEVDIGYHPRISNTHRSFLHELLAGMGEDEARRLLAHLNDCVVDKTFSVSETIDNAVVEFHVTRE